MSSESEPNPGTVPGARLSGCVYLPDGTPAKGALVALSINEGGPDIAASTDTEGSFHLPMRAAAKGIVTATVGSLHASVPIESNEQPVVLHLKELKS